MPFSIGQSEQFGYYKQITNWSTVYDADLSEEIANPERLTVGTLDFGFVLLCLFPILLIILVFNVGGTERDLDFMKLLQMQSDNIQKWLLVRYFFYFIFSVLLLLLLIIPCSLYLNVTFSIVLNYYLVCIGYILFWFIIFYYIALYSKSSADQSLKMIGVWLLFCVLLPGTIHQITNMKFTPSLMTDYLDANRKDTYALFELKPEVIKEMVTTAHPNLKNTAFSKDTIINTDITNNSSSALVNSIMKKAAKKLFDSNEKRNNFIKNTYVINPFGFFQNKLNAICSTDYYAFQNYKNQIQTAIDIKIKTMLLSEWNKEIIDKEKYKNFLKIATDEKK